MKRDDAPLTFSVPVEPTRTFPVPDRSPPVQFIVPSTATSPAPPRAPLARFSVPPGCTSSTAALSVPPAAVTVIALGMLAVPVALIVPLVNVMFGNTRSPLWSMLTAAPPTWLIALSVSVGEVFSSSIAPLVVLLALKALTALPAPKSEAPAVVDASSEPAAIVVCVVCVIEFACSATMPAVRIAVPMPEAVPFITISPPAVTVMMPLPMLSAGEPMREPALATVPGLSVTLPPTVIPMYVFCPPRMPLPMALPESLASPPVIERLPPTLRVALVSLGVVPPKPPMRAPPPEVAVAVDAPPTSITLPPTSMVWSGALIAAKFAVPALPPNSTIVAAVMFCCVPLHRRAKFSIPSPPLR